MIWAFAAANYFACIAIVGGVFGIVWLSVFSMTLVSVCFTAIGALGTRYYLERSVEKRGS
jgi:Flp pilus assembly protein TadB